MRKHYVWGEWRSDQELQEIAREMNKPVEQKLYKEIFRKLLGEVKGNQSLNSRLGWFLLSVKNWIEFHSPL